MGKVIKKTIKGLSFRVKVSIILTFTLLFSVFMYQGWYRPFSIQATVDTPADGTNWTCPTGVYAVKVECWGGGGGGGGTTDNGGAGGGGGGGYSSSIVSVIPGNGYAIAVGAAGTAGAGNNGTGGTGGTSSFGVSTVVANGGSGGTGGASGARGTGAAAGTGNLAAFIGGNGAAGTASASGGGGGGAGSGGNGGSATGATAGSGTATGGGTGGAGRTTDTAGLAGGASGGGGSGGFDAGGAASGGGAGAVGKVTVTYISITGISPNNMNQGTGPTTVTINGTEFASGATVTFSGTGVTAGASTFVNPTQITVPVTVTAGATVGARDVTVTNPGPAAMSTTGAGLFTVNAPATTTLGTGVNATTAPVGPGTTQKLGGLSFAANTGTDSVTALTVTTTGQTAIASMQIWNEAGTQQYFGTVANPGSNTWNFSGGTAIPVTTTTQNYKIVVTYYNHATAPNADTATTGYVSAYTCSNAKAGTDSAEATLTLDNTASTAAVWGSNSGGTSVTLNWTNGSGGNIMIARYTANTDTTMPTDGNTYVVTNSYGTGGTVIYAGTGTTTTDSPVSSGTYYYKAFAYDGFQNYATSAPWSAGIVVDKTAPTVSSTIPSNNATGVTSNSAVTINWSENVNCSTVNTTNITMSAGGWGLSTCSGSQAVFTTSGQANNTTYNVTVGTGVTDTLGNAMSASYPFSYTTAAAAGVNGTTCGTATAAQASATSILVSMPYTDDANGNNTYLVEYKQGSGSYVVWPPNPQSHTTSPFITTITGLTTGQNYTVQVTYQDANGIAGGIATQVIGPITLAAWADNGLLHNSNRFAGTTKWSGNWGTPTGQYGAFVCETCHYETGSNIKDIKESITAPSGSFPGQSGGSSINFQSRTSPNGFGNDLRVPNTTSTYVCEYCHSQTSVHRYNASGQTDFNHKSANNTNCLSCHPHNTGFKASCAGCHGFPPTSVATLASPATSALPGGQAGAHDIHVTTRGFTCDACHNAYTTNPMGNQKIEIGFSLNNTNVPGFQGSVTSGTFTGNLNANLTNSYTWQSPSNSAGTTMNQAANTTTCSVWCHGSWTGSNGTATAASWVGGSSQASVCGACHGKDAATAPTAGSHARHAGLGAGKLSLLCSDCHGADPTNNVHVNGSIYWKLNTANVKFGSAATYKGSAEQSSAVPSTYGTCSVYCHSSVQNATGSAVAAPTTTLAWGTAGPLTCDTSNCHGNPPAGGGSHDQHNVTGYTFACSICHTGAGDETSKHADYKIDVAFSGVGSGGTYTQSATNPPGNGFGNCGNIYCHSDGKATPGSYATPTWGTAASGACGTCHRLQDTNTNMAAAGSPSSLTAAHYKHVATDRYGLNTAYNCGACHAETASNNTTLLVAGGKHVNNARDWKFGTFGGYDQSGGVYTTSCANTYCHSKGRATTAPFTAPVSNILWSAGAGSSNCATTCHAGNATAANVTTNGPFDSHVDHIATDTYNLTCAECHAETVAAGTSTTLNATTGYTKHVNGAKDWKFGTSVRGNAAISQATGTYTTGTCANIYCHSKGTMMSSAPGAATYTGNHAPYQTATWTGTFGCNGCHGDATNTDGRPAYTNGTPKANSHQSHTSYTCDKCHYLVTTTGTTIAASGIANHIDGNYDVANSAGNLTYAMGTLTGGIPAGGTCSGTGMVTGCHGSSANFTGLGPDMLQLPRGAADTNVFAAGTAAIINTTE